MRFQFLLFHFIFCGLTTKLFAYPPTFGGEIEFTNDEIDNAQYDFGGDTWRLSDKSSEMQDAFQDEVYKVCKGCHIRMLWDHDGVATYRVSYPDGWWFQISMDPHVIEIQTKAATLKELKKLRGRIQNDIFDVAKRIGLKAGVRDSGGHIHIGADSAFDGDAKLFRNFLVDFINHSELANGILVYDHNNAPPVQSLSADQRAGFERVIREFDNGERKTMEELAEGLISQVYYETKEESWAPPEKFHALNVVRIFEILQFRRPDRTLEIRCLRGQKSADEFILETELFQSRLEYLKKLPGPLKVIWGPPSRDSQALLNGFYRYVVESGLKWEDYKGLLPKKFQKLDPTVVILEPEKQPLKQKKEIIPRLTKSKATPLAKGAERRSSKKGCRILLSNRVKTR